MPKKLTPDEQTEVTRLVVRAQTESRVAWAHCKDTQAANYCEEIHRLLANALRLLAPEIPDAPKGA